MDKRRYVLAFFLLFISFFLFPVFHFELKDRHQNQICFVERVSEGDLLRFSYIHSVEKIPVEAVIRISRRGFKIIETEAPSYGAGLPNVVPDHLVKREKGTFRVFVDSEVMNPFTFFISAITHPVLQSKRTKILLAEKVTEGGVMELRVKQTPFFLFLLRKSLCNYFLVKE